MNGKYVPGGSVPSREEQIRWLLEKLAGRDWFKRLRRDGMFDGPGLDLSLTTLVDITDSPAELKRRLAAFVADMQIAGDLLARFKRDEWEEAARLLTRSLYDPTFMLPGETTPIEQTTLITLVMLIPEKTLAMIDWLRQGKEREHLVRRYFNHRVEQPETTTLFDLCASLEGCMIRQLKSHNENMGVAFSSSHWEEHDAEGQAWPKDAANLLIPALHLAWYSYSGEFDLKCFRPVRQWFGDPSHMLDQIPRSTQRHIATWTIRVPTVLLEERRRGLFWIFHPEAEHAFWSGVPNAFASIGCSHGYGAVALNTEGKSHHPRLLAGSSDPKTNLAPYMLAKAPEEPLRFMLFG